MAKRCVMAMGISPNPLDRVIQSKGTTHAQYNHASLFLEGANRGCKDFRRFMQDPPEGEKRQYSLQRATYKALISLSKNGKRSVSILYWLTWLWKNRWIDFIMAMIIKTISPESVMLGWSDDGEKTGWLDEVSGDSGKMGASCGCVALTDIK